MPMDLNFKVILKMTYLMDMEESKSMMDLGMLAVQCWDVQWARKVSLGRWQ
jgi:hypothetical protein